MKKLKTKTTIKSLLVVVVLLAVALFAAGLYANPTGQQGITITYSAGKYLPHGNTYGTTENTGLFADFTISAETTVSDTLILPGDTFAENVAEGNATLNIGTAAAEVTAPEAAMLPEDDTIAPEGDTAPPEDDTIAPEGDTAPPEDDTIAPEGDTAPPENAPIEGEIDLTAPTVEVTPEEAAAAVSAEESVKEDTEVPKEEPAEETVVPEEESAPTEEEPAAPEASVEIEDAAQAEQEAPLYGEEGTVPAAESAQLDSETFYFTDAGQAGYADDWAYTFVGWKIVGTEKNIPGETVFQPGDVMIPRILEKYASGGALKLEALWAKCYFIENPYTTMKYTLTKDATDNKGNPIKLYELSTTTSTGETGAKDTNTGNNPNAPKATLDGLFASIRAELGSTVNEGKSNPRTYDTYSTAVVLTGDLDYYTDTNQSEVKYYGYAESPKNSSNNSDTAYGVYVSATYKSLGGANYTYNYKPKGYSNYLYGNFRFDNVNFRLIPEGIFGGQTRGNEWIMSHLRDSWNADSHIEFTARYNRTLAGTSAIVTFRPGDATYVVVNGGSFGGMQNQYSSSVTTGKDLFWTIGRNARISGTLTCGTTSAYEDNCLNLYYDYEVNILGGRINEFCGGNSGLNTIGLGKREFHLLGDGDANNGKTDNKQYEYDPKITNFYGGAAQARLYSDIVLTGKNCSYLGNVYGGGRDYSATIFGNIDITLENCVLTGDLFGGGQNGNCEITPSTYIQYKPDTSTSEKKAIGEEKELSTFLGGVLTDRINTGGTVNIDLKSTKVNGNVFGSGMGKTQVLEIRTQMGINDSWKTANGVITKEDNIFPEDAGDWSKPIEGYPHYNPEDGRVMVHGFRSGAYTMTAPNNMAYYTTRSYAYLSLATVQNVHIKIDGSVIGTNVTNGKGNIYGGGSIAKVLGDTTIEITNSIVYGNVYGGGDGVTVPEKIKVYQPDSTTPGDPEFYQPAWYIGTENADGTSWTITWYDQQPEPKKDSVGTFTKKAYEEYTWSNDKALLAEPYNGIDSENKLLYSPNTDGLGSVNGNTKVTIDNTTVKKNVYGGGNFGIVFGNTEVLVSGEATSIEGQVFGGGNGDISREQTAVLGAVEGNSALTITGGTVNEAYGGCNAADVGMEDSETKAVTGGTVTLNITGGTVTNAYGGNNIKGDIKGQINATLSGGQIVDKLFGGGNKAPYKGITNLTISGGKVGELSTPEEPNGTVKGCAYGGGREAEVYGAKTTISGGRLRAFVGGSLKANITAQPDQLDAIQVYVSGETLTAITTFMGGNDQFGEIKGNIRLVVGLSEENLFVKDGAGNPTGTINVAGACPDENIKITNFFGGGNNADYDWGMEWELPETNPGQDAPVEGYEGITITAVSGTIYQMFGGGVLADISNVRSAIYSGEYHFLYGGGFQGDSRSSATHIRGGEYVGDWLVYDQDTLPTETQGGYVFGGGYEGYAENAIVHVEGTEVSIAHSIFAGGNKAGVGSSKVVIKSGNVIGSVYGGGYEGASGVNKDGTANEAYRSEVCLYGGIIGQEAAGSVSTYMGNIYGGGYRGISHDTHIDVAAYVKAEVTTELKFGGNIYGGGHEANVEGDTYVHFVTGKIDGNIYGGGRDGDVLGETHVDIMAGIIGGSVYGGGYMGEVQGTHVLISDQLEVIEELEDEYLKNAFLLAPKDDQHIQIEKDVFGGGHGITATVLDSTAVRVDMEYDLDVKEEAVTSTSEVTSGEIKTTVTAKEGYSKIAGSVYGGGDLGQVGQGVINISNNTARVTKAGSATVTINAGHIGDKVFGGGNGMPPEGQSYNVYMGTVFGKTRTNIYGGYVESNIYGGGRQSRLYTADNNEYVALVTIDENQNSGNVIAIGGSVFGGGERGPGTTTNASVPTTVGKVKVDILSKKDVKSEIYFVHGGIYGDGNLCLVNGHREIHIKNLNEGPNAVNLKTFYSFQRADLVVMDHTKVVLLGAIDLVEEGDTTVYSINRVGKLEMANGSTIKLDQIVKNLGALESDVETDRQFIFEGANKKNNYTDVDPKQPLGTYNGAVPVYKPADGTQLTDSQIEEVVAYRNGSFKVNAGTGEVLQDIYKNVVCVANGLYLEVKTDEVYGPVTGLFTLELLHANPGEGGGYVYGDIKSSTGDFICETSRGYTYQAWPNITAFETGKEYYTRVVGQGYVRAESWQSGVLYFTREPVTEDMDVVDNVGGKLENNKRKYYYWYIGGPSIPYTGSITGYIGTDQPTYSKGYIIPQHSELLEYALYGIESNDTLKQAIAANGAYTLVQKKENLTQKEIALEVSLGGQSVGFLTYDASKGWGIYQPAGSGSKTLYGYKGISADREKNSLRLEFAVGADNDTVEIHLHKSKDVITEVEGMEFTFELDLLHDGVPYGGPTNNLVFTTNVNIVRMDPEQKVFANDSKRFGGVGTTADINITAQSAFTVEYQTEYLASAFPYEAGVSNKNMDWLISTSGYSYYVDYTYGRYITLNAAGQVVNYSPDLTIRTVDGQQNFDVINPETDHTLFTVFKNGGKYSYYVEVAGEGDNNTLNKIDFELQGSAENSKIPKDTKITMIDLSAELPTYYYYICKQDTTEINLKDFCLMGTSKKISENDTKDPYFMQEYRENKPEVLKERIAFVFDSFNVDWSSSFNGSLFLNHRYAGQEMMDYVKSSPEGETAYTRESPRYVTYTVNKDKTGIGEWTAEIVPADGRNYVYSKDSFELDVMFREDDYWTNTLFGAQDYSLMIELVDGTDVKTAQRVQMPAGIRFEFDGEIYYPGSDGKHVIIPVNNIGSEDVVKVRNILYPLELGEMHFRVTLYSAPDALYYNTHENIVPKIVSTTVKEAPVHAVETFTENALIEQGDKLSFNIKAKSEGEDVDNTFSLSLEYKATGQSSYTAADWSTVFSTDKPELGPTAGQDIELKTKSGASAGSYRLVFEFGDHTEYLYFIIYSK